MTTESHIRHLTTVINVATLFMHKDFNALWRSTCAKFATNMVTFPVYATKRRPRCITRTVTEILKHTNFMQVPCMHRTVPITVILRSPALMNHFSYSYKPKAIMLKVSRFQIHVHLITNLAYHLKLHHTRNMYLWAWLDTCANVNIMPASTYQLVFKDLEMKKIKPCKMQISTYSWHCQNHRIMHIWCCPPRHQEMVPVTFYLASNDGMYYCYARQL